MNGSNIAILEMVQRSSESHIKEDADELSRGVSIGKRAIVIGLVVVCMIFVFGIALVVLHVGFDLMKQLSGSQASDNSNAPFSMKSKSKCNDQQVAAKKQCAGRFGCHIPQCEIDGRFSMVQCHEHYCWCVNSQGQEIIGSKNQNSNSLEMKCPEYRQLLCERVKKQQIEECAGSYGCVIAQCDRKGFFLPKQCHDGFCNCVTEKGTKIEGTDGNTLNVPKCSNEPICFQTLYQKECQNGASSRIGYTFNGIKCVYINSCAEGDNFFKTIDECAESCPGILCNNDDDCPWNAWCGISGPEMTFKTCKLYQGEGEKCEGYVVPWSRNKCFPDLYCEYSSIPDLPGSCTAITTACQIQRQKDRQNCNTNNSSLCFQTVCRRDGSFRIYQCMLRTAGEECWCVNQEGQKIEGTESYGSITCPTD